MRVGCVSLALALLGLASVPMAAQQALPVSSTADVPAAASTTGAESVSGTHDAREDSNGKPAKKAKVKLPKPHPISIVNGTFTVDGWTGKAHLNYDISDLKYIFLSVPSVGTVIVSQVPFSGAVEQKGAFDLRTLTVSVGEHQLQLASDKILLPKKMDAAWVKVDPTYTADPRYPVMGYGTSSNAPYEWPATASEKPFGMKDAPPLPAGMQPKSAARCSGSCGTANVTPTERASL